MWERERRREIEVTLRDGSHMYSHLYTAEQQRERERKEGGALSIAQKSPRGIKAPFRGVCVLPVASTHTHTDSLNLLEREHGKRDDFFVLFFREGGWIQRKKEVLYK